MILWTSNNINIGGFLNILIAAKESKIKRIVMPAPPPFMVMEKILSKQKSQPDHSFSICHHQYVDELYADVFSKLYQMECIGLRYFNVFGPRQDPNADYAAVVPTFVKMLVQNQIPIINGDGSFSRDFTFVQNVVTANILALTVQNKAAINQVYNVGTGNSITLNNPF